MPAYNGAKHSLLIFLGDPLNYIGYICIIVIINIQEHDIHNILYVFFASHWKYTSNHNYRVSNTPRTMVMI